jgi:YjbR
MVTYAVAKRIALSFPEATEQPHHDMGSFRVRGKIFATVPNKRHLHVSVDEHESRAAAAEDSEAFELLWWGEEAEPPARHARGRRS